MLRLQDGMPVMPTQSQDIQTLKTDVALIKQEQGNQTKTLTGINEKLDGLTFVSQKDYDNDMLGEDGIMARLKRLEGTVNQGGVKIANALNSGVSKAIIGALVIGVLALIVWSLARVTPALGGA